MKQIPAQDIRAAGHAGVVNYVATRLDHGRQAHHPALCQVAGRGRTGDRQQLPVRQAHTLRATECETPHAFAAWLIEPVLPNTATITSRSTTPR
jgi:hypothetical protein